jgi:pyroglutamyl-peptidase
MRLLVTGFGPFLDHTANPSQALAESCGAPFVVLEVSYRSVIGFIESLDASSFDALLSIGLADKAEAAQFETVGRNFVGATPDVRGEVFGPGVIDPTGPPAIASTLWHGLDTSEAVPSADAGGYLCNYLLYLALRRFPQRRVGFLHVPPFEVMHADRQRALVGSLCRQLAG